MSDLSKTNYQLALEDFYRARRQADTRRILAALRGRSSRLLSYDEVRSRLKAVSSREIGLREIPIEAIVGSVNRYTDFTQDFLPKSSINSERWARVGAQFHDLEGVPPIQVYKLGQAYFVLDGNHRVSVARSLGSTTIQAYVTEIQSRVPLAADDTPEDLILKTEQAEFLEATRVDRIRPQADLTVTAPSKYASLLEHIRVHQYYLGLDQQRDIPMDEAVASWYDNVYLPVVQIIRRRGMLADFPGRSETDLYLWILEHQAELVTSLGWQVAADEAATDLASRSSGSASRLIGRVSRALRDLITPDELEVGPPAGLWRRERQTAEAGHNLFSAILVPVSGSDSSWRALEQALLLARRENSQVRGLHIGPRQMAFSWYNPAHIQAEFDRRCQAGGIPGRLIVESGPVARRIADRARWADLVVVNLNFPPGSRPFTRWKSGFRKLIRLSPRPILAVPCQAADIRRALLAYDDSPTSREALFIAAYLAGRLGIDLTVLAVAPPGRAALPGALDHARSYLEQMGLAAEYLARPGKVSDVILETAETCQADLILMGSYDSNPLVELFLGSVLEQVLRDSARPTLICR